jgi:hypothetical protein
MNYLIPQLVRLSIEYRAVSKNPKIRRMFTSSKVGNEIGAFVRKHNLLLDLIRNAAGESDGFELSGEFDGVQKFMRKYLSEDAESGLYMLNVNKPGAC